MDLDIFLMDEMFDRGLVEEKLDTAINEGRQLCS